MVALTDLSLPGQRGCRTDGYCKRAGLTDKSAKMKMTIHAGG
jgi:hypothetical protein